MSPFQFNGTAEYIFSNADLLTFHKKMLFEVFLFAVLLEITSIWYLEHTETE